jgi:hypothetical protein
MKRIAVVALALGIAAAPAYAQPTKMSDAQLDQVAGGIADVSVSLTDSANVNVTVSPSVNVSPTVTVSVL